MRLKPRHWLLVLGWLIAGAGMSAVSFPWWAALLLLLGGGLIGVWAAEGERAHARERGLDIPPL